MKKLKFNPDNAKYYSEEFIKGFECGVERQFNADMEEKTAKWINETEETIECGNCHHIFDDFGLLNGDQEKFYEYPNFCPNCGRKMIGVEMKGVEK